MNWQRLVRGAGAANHFIQLNCVRPAPDESRA
jgi:hypothetical protein